MEDFSDKTLQNNRITKALPLWQPSSIRVINGRVSVRMPDAGNSRAPFEVILQVPT